mmetsp:Transcript_6617/g.12094  ORF Transcript_6617/g.12094 Transcript_6617/m.12094 type:complete len:104 (-) Transcript_6617:1300-1611(-)
MLYPVWTSHVCHYSKRFQNTLQFRTCWSSSSAFLVCACSLFKLNFSSIVLVSLLIAMVLEAPEASDADMEELPAKQTSMEKLSKHISFTPSISENTNSQSPVS